MNLLRIAFLHLAPRLGALDFNRDQLEAAVTQAANEGATWVLTPELCLSGYAFAPILGTDWIQPQPDAWMGGFMETIGRLGITVFLGHAERDAETSRLHNTVFVIGGQGEILGRHRKINVVPVVETWASAGDSARPFPVPPLQAGILVCADAYTPGIARALLAEGAEIILSSAAWGPRPHGPEGSWEARSRETGLPLLVCNRTGQDGALDFRDAETVVVTGGKRRFSHRGLESEIILVDWNLETMDLQAHTGTFPVR